MSTAPKPAAAPTPERQILVISHSTLFYWWLVWAVGFLMALITAVSDVRLAVVPKDTVPEPAKADYKVEITITHPTDASKSDTLKGREVLIAPQGEKLPRYRKTDTPETPHLHISRSKDLGVLFIIVLLLVIFITNVPLRGLWSVIVIVFIVALSIIFHLLEFWEVIMRYLSFLDIRINLGGYLFFSIVLFILWLVVFLLFDQQVYMVFTPGQLRVRLEIGGAETAYDTSGMTIQKQRSDVFRHWVLGLGSGDLIVRTSGAQSHTFDMPNVLFLGKKVREIEDMLRMKQVVSGGPQH